MITMFVPATTKGRRIDNVTVKRLRQLAKCECVYLQAFETGLQMRAVIAPGIDYCNIKKPHSALTGWTSEEIYDQNRPSSPGHLPEKAPEVPGA